MEIGIYFVYFIVGFVLAKLPLFFRGGSSSKKSNQKAK